MICMNIDIDTKRRKDLKRKLFRMRQSMSFALAMMMAVSNISGSVNVMAEGMEMDYSSVVEEEGADGTIYIGAAVL